MSITESFKFIALAEAKQPKFSEKKGNKGGYTNYGENNDYPEYLVELFNKSPKHNAIIRSKVHYITGNGWTGGDDAKQFIENANSDESLNDITRKIDLDIEIFGGAYIEIIWNELGNIAAIYHVDYTKIRTNKDNTQFWYKFDWTDNNEEAKIIPAFNPTLEDRTKQILYIKEYRPNIGIYALPSYFGSLNYIEADVEVSKHVLANAQTGFSASKLIVFTNGEPTDEEKATIEKKIKKTYSGADGKKFMVAFVNDASRKPIIEDLGTSDLTKEDFGRVDSLIQTNIFSGHQITTPSIFGIAEAGKLGSRTEMRDGYEIFKNTYVNGKQMQLESAMNMIASYMDIKSELKIIPTEPIGMELSEQTLIQIAPKEWLLEKAGIDITKYQNNATQQSLNDAFGVFYEFGESKEDYDILKRKKRFSDDTDMQLFAEALTYEEIQLKNNILDQINKQNNITADVLSDVLGVSIDEINKSIAILEEEGAIKTTYDKVGKGINQNVIISRQLTKPLSKLVGKIKPETREISVRYSYDWKEGFSDSDKKNSRPFCVALLDANKLYSRADIERMTQKLGYSVWDRKGGWYNEGGGVISEECRHQWVTNIVSKKNKK